MTKSTTPILIGGALLLSLALAIGAYWSSAFAQNLLLELCGTALSLAVGLVVVDVYLKSEEKRRAVAPLHQMIQPFVETFHNDYVIDKGFAAFGIPGFKELLKAYSDNGGNPQALSPQQRDRLFEVIRTNHTGVLEILLLLNDRLQHLSLLLGWSFSTKIMQEVLKCRNDIGMFKRLTLEDDDRIKLDACKLFLDIDASSSTLYAELASLRGLREHQYQANEKPRPQRSITQ